MRVVIDMAARDETVRVQVDRAAIAEFCKRNRIRKLAFFGSVLRDDFGPDSDVDVLVEFEEDARVSLLDIVRMEEELSRILGRVVDMRTPRDLSRYFRDEVVRNAVIQYVAE